MLERRSIVGGACVTEEFAPGFHASPGAYVLSMLRPAVRRDMRLDARGLTVSPAGPTLNVFPDGSRLVIGGDATTAPRTMRALLARRRPGAAALQGGDGGDRPGRHAAARRDAARSAAHRRAARRRRPRTRGSPRLRAPQASCRRRLPDRDLGEPVPRRALRVRRGQGGARLGRHRQHARRADRRPAPRSRCCTSTASSTRTGRPGASCAAAWARSPA